MFDGIIGTINSISAAIIDFLFGCTEIEFGEGYGGLEV
jgi:hypothetical protein